MASQSSFLAKKHLKFLDRCLNCFPQEYQSLDTTRLTLLFFVLSGLDVLGEIDTISEDKKQEIIDWIYSFQLTIKQGVLPKSCGFRAAVVSGENQSASTLYESGHLAMSYSALNCLLILGDDLSKVDRLGVLANVKACQLPDGSFCATPGGSENDMRFIYCATSICFILNDFRAIDIPAAVSYLKRSINFDGGIGQGPFLESHGGSTYCGIASLSMLKKELDPKVIKRLETWLVNRYEVGFNGRANKPDDSCYTFWIGASLKILNLDDKIEKEKGKAFVLSTQDSTVGGFGKYPDTLPDVLHTYLSLAGLSILAQPQLKPLNPHLNITSRAASHLASLQNNWPSLEEVDYAKINCCKES